MLEEQSVAGFSRLSLGKDPLDDLDISGCHRDGSEIRAQLPCSLFGCTKIPDLQKEVADPVWGSSLDNSTELAQGFHPFPLAFLGHYAGCYLCSEADLMLVNHENCIAPKIIALELGISELPLDLTLYRLQESDLILVPLFTAL